MERARSGLDGLGAQARKDRGVQPAAARVHGHELRRADRRRPHVLPSVRYCLTLDSDTRLPRDAARKLLGIISAPAQSGAHRSGVAPGHRGLRHPAAARQRHDGERRRLAVRPHLRRATRASIPTPRPCRTSIRICSARGSSPARASTTSTRSRPPSRTASPRTRCCPTTSSRGSLREPRSYRTSRSWTTIPSSVLAHARRQHRWVRGDWQILLWLFPFVPTRTGPGAQPPAAHLALEDSRQPEAQPRRARDASPCSSRAGRSCPAARRVWTLAALAALAFAAVAVARRNRRWLRGRGSPGPCWRATLSTT